MGNSKVLTPSSKRYAYIDVLRGLAALLVVYQHTSEVTLYLPTHANWLEAAIIEFFTKVIGIGEVGVCIFLMISGFVVPFSLLKYRFNPIRKFATHRFFRLYPAYWLSVLLGLIFVQWRFGTQYGGHEISWLTFFANLTMFQTFFGFGDIMGQYWTLALELVFYFLCAGLFLFKRLDSFKSMMLLLLSVIVSREICRHLLASGSHAFDVFTNLRYLDFMFFGLQYRQWLLDGNRKAGVQAIFMLLFAFLSFGAPTDIRHFIGGDNFALKTELSQLSAVAIFVLFTKWHQPSNRIGLFLGKISYSIYLFHPIVFYLLFLYWFQTSSIQSYPHVFVMLSVVLTVLVSDFTYRMLERPFVLLGSRLFSGDKFPLKTYQGKFLKSRNCDDEDNPDERATPFL